jgi:hypothetical protein
MQPAEYIKVCYAPKECLHDKAYAWSVDGRQLTLQLKKELFAQVIGWPIDLRNQVTGDILQRLPVDLNQDGFRRAG